MPRPQRWKGGAEGVHEIARGWGWGWGDACEQRETRLSAIDYTIATVTLPSRFWHLFAWPLSSDMYGLLDGIIWYTAYYLRYYCMY